MAAISIKELRRQKAKLLILAQKQRKVDNERKSKQMEAIKLRNEIAKLKQETRKDVFARISRAAKSPDAKLKVKQGKKVLKGIDKFLKKHGM